MKIMKILMKESNEMKWNNNNEKWNNGKCNEIIMKKWKWKWMKMKNEIMWIMYDNEKWMKNKLSNNNNEIMKMKW